MDLLDILDALDERGANFTLTGGRLKYAGPADLAEHVARWRDHLVCHRSGAPGGHAFAFCTVCREATMVHIDRKPIACRMTPGCTGEHIVRPADLERIKALDHRPAPKGFKPPARPPKSRLLGDMPPFPMWNSKTKAA
jgi:hypothetical protein